ncbi:MAG TPA: hypothetical protein VFT31_01525 [Kribbella sp.]|nr:hypothetical protein [Kribbella sp.]
MSETFVVGLKQAEVLRRREVVRRARRLGAWTTLALGVTGIAIAVGFTVAFPGAGLWPYALLLVASMSPLVLSTVQARRLAVEQQRWYAANGVPPAAMRMSATVLELACDGAEFPVVLPWATVRGFRQKRRLGQSVLELVLARGVGATTAGVRGLAQPAVRAVVKPSPLLQPVGLYPVAALDQPVHVIDQAMRHFSGGRAGVLRP